MTWEGAKFGDSLTQNLLVPDKQPSGKFTKLNI